MDLDSEDEIMSGDPQKLFAALSQGKNSKIPMPTFPTLSEVQNQVRERAKEYSTSEVLFARS